MDITWKDLAHTHPVMHRSPQELIDENFSPMEFDRAGRYRIYELCNYIEGILNGTIEIK